MAALSGGCGTRRGWTRNHWCFHHSRLHGHGHGTRQFYIDDPRRSLVRLGQDAPPPLVRTSHEGEGRAKMNRSKWDQRIHRADALVAAHPFAAEALQFYKRMAIFQQELYSDGEGACGNVRLMLAKFTGFLSTVATCAPQLIAESARDLNVQGTERWQDLLTSFWQTASDF